MGKALQDNLRMVLSRAVEEAARSAGQTRRNDSASGRADSSGPLSGPRGVLVGAGAAALAPAAVKGASKLLRGVTLDGIGDIAATPAKAVEKLGDGVGGAIGDKLSQKVDESGGPSGLLKDAAKSALPFGGGGSGGGKGGAPGVGKGRRMPVQQNIDIGLPIETVYNQWTQFEEWPNFMHRVNRVTQEDDCTVSVGVKLWGKTKEFTANIETQRPDERIKWSTSQGVTHTGVVTFHELGPSLTRVLLGFDVDPGGVLEKLARGARYIKRAARADLHRFKAFIETQEKETGAWRGRIEDGELVEEHDPSYDEKREYADNEKSKRGSKDRRAKRRSSGSSRAASRRSGSRQTSSARSRGSRARSSGSSRASSNARSGSSSRSRSNARSGANSSSGRSSRSKGRSGSATRSRTQASRSNGRG